ncbi:hypothetical protein GUJ93_ZPchr0010g8905 [Zizania palustris]|uniref:Uncharacterized protein n=1 Tax=Zizania palustris TaxID=103762 RepID=A0A8J5WB63_ZIZPA|nr:hypothetical protein GUJ93_ZPchr0010g8905 [Zizania palustris]
MAAHGKLKPHAPPPPPPPPPEARRGFMRRMFPFLLAANLFVGGQISERSILFGKPSTIGKVCLSSASMFVLHRSVSSANLPLNKWIMLHFSSDTSSEQQPTYLDDFHNRIAVQAKK